MRKQNTHEMNINEWNHKHNEEWQEPRENKEKSIYYLEFTSYCITFEHDDASPCVHQRKQQASRDAYASLIPRCTKHRRARTHTHKTRWNDSCFSSTYNHGNCIEIHKSPYQIHLKIIIMTKKKWRQQQQHTQTAWFWCLK